MKIELDHFIIQRSERLGKHHTNQIKYDAIHLPYLICKKEINQQKLENR